MDHLTTRDKGVYIDMDHLTTRDFGEMHDLDHSTSGKKQAMCQSQDENQA